MGLRMYQDIDDGQYMERLLSVKDESSGLHMEDNPRSSRSTPTAENKDKTRGINAKYV